MSPDFDRRRLERLAVGAPMPIPRALRRGIGARLGSLRRVGAWRPHPVAPAEEPEPPPEAVFEPEPPPEAVLEPEPPPEAVLEPEPPLEAVFEPEPSPQEVLEPEPPRPQAPRRNPLVLLLVAESLRGEAAAAEAILRAAQRFATGERGVILLDTDPAGSGLEEALGIEGGTDGLAEALEYGISLRGIAQQPSDRTFRFVPAGGGAPLDVAGHPGWDKLVREAGRRELLLLATVPEGMQGVEALVRRSGEVVLVTARSEEGRLRLGLPTGTRVLGVISPPRPKLAAPEDTSEAVREAIAPDLSTPPPPPPPANGEAPRQRTIRKRPGAEEPAGLRGAAASLGRWLRGEEARLRGGQPPAEKDEEADQRAATEEPRSFRDSIASALSLGSRPAPDEAEEDLEAPFSPSVYLRPVEEIPAKYIVPRLPEWRETLIRVAAVLILAFWTYYIVWRWAETLNLDALWFSIPLVLAESWAWLTALLFVFTTWRLNHREPKPPPPGASVDVFITTFDEPLEVIRRTAISAREIRYPHTTYVLDDGRRDEVRAMAEELGIRYLRRDDNEHAKAGNLNHALGLTSGEFILQLDADHAPLPHILDRLLGFFDDPDVAFVQTPQDFYNIDSFTTELNEDAQRLWEEQRLFFSVILPGKDRTNSAFFCGSCAIIRRSALEEIGGISTRSITEDIETSLLLHGRGWVSVYYGETLAYGLAAGSAEAFHTQHARWARGAMQVLRAFNPLTHRGLTWEQRLGYFYSLTAYVIGLQKFIFYAAPLVFFATGILPIDALDREFLLHFVPYLILSFVLAELLARGLGFTWLTERYQMAKFWTYARSLPTYLTSRRLPFLVTPKGPGGVATRTYLPQLTLMILTVLAVNWASVAHVMGWIDYGVDGWRSLAFQANFLWAGLNFVLAAYVVNLSARIQQQRHDYRFADRLPLEVRLRDGRGRLSERLIGLTEDLNASGIRFRSVRHFPPGTELRLTLPLSTGEVSVHGLVVHSTGEGAGEVPVYVHGVEFRNTAFDVRDAIELHCAQHAVPSQHLRYYAAPGIFSRAHEWVRNARGEPRRRVRLAAWVAIEQEEGDAPTTGIGLLEEISRGGARLVLDRPVPPGTWISFDVPHTELQGAGRAVFSQALETPIGVRFAVGMRRESGSQNQSPRKKRMGIPRIWRTIGASTAITAALTTAQPAEAQWETAIFGAGEFDTEDLSLFLLGVSLTPEGLGLKPVGILYGYRLTHPVRDDDRSIGALHPAAGIRYQWIPGAVQATVGYLMVSEDDDELLDDPIVGAPGGAEEGFTGAIQGDYWGTGVRTGQFIASHNFADSYFWGRVRGAQRILDLDPAAVRLGLEAVYQADDFLTSDEDIDLFDPEPYQAFQVAPIVEYSAGPTFTLIGGAGLKTDNIVGNPDTFPFFKIEFVFLP